MRSLDAGEQKRYATVQAELALKGYALCRIDNDAGMPLFIVSRWSLTRDFTSLNEVETFVETVTGGPP